MSILDLSINARGKSSTVALGFLYFMIYGYVYTTLVSPRFSYMGMYYTPGSNYQIGLAALFVGIILLALPVQLQRLSDFYCWIIFLVTFLPAQFIIATQGVLPNGPVALMGSLFLSFLAIIVIPKYFVLAKFKDWQHISHRSILFFVVSCQLLLLTLIFINFRGAMSFAGLDDIYIQRATAADRASQIANPILGYGMAMLGTAINPYLITVGLFRKSKRWCLLLGVFGQIFIYMIFAGKAVLSGLILMVCFYFYNRAKSRVLVAKTLLGVTVFLFLIVLLLDVVFVNSNEGILFNVSSIFLMRTFSIGAAMNGIYASFFEANPFTYYSHINVVNQFVDYPYPSPLGVVVGIDLVGGAGFNANANFWATDGSAAFGNLGVVFIGIVFGVYLTIANAAVDQSKLFFAATLSIPYVITMNNAGFFTSLITGGGILLLILILFGEPKENQR